MPLRKDVVTAPYDFADYILTDDDVRAALAGAFEDGDPVIMASMLGDVARSRGMAAVADRAGVTPKSLYKSLSATGNPEFRTIVKVLEALGMKLALRTATGAGEVQATAPARSARVIPIVPRGVRDITPKREATMTVGAKPSKPAQPAAKKPSAAVAKSAAKKVAPMKGAAKPVQPKDPRRLKA